MTWLKTLTTFPRSLTLLRKCRVFNPCQFKIRSLNGPVRGPERAGRFLSASQNRVSFSPRYRLGCFVFSAAVTGSFPVQQAHQTRVRLLVDCRGRADDLAGEEFADQHDLTTGHPDKQRDAVNFQRTEDDWRKRILDYAARLVKLRTSYEALAVNDTDFIHIDFNDGKRVLVWKRGQESSGKLVVVVANFSACGTDVRRPDAEYVVPNWPATPPGKTWREVTQARSVPPQWVGREPLYPWEGKVYALV